MISAELRTARVAVRNCLFGLVGGILLAIPGVIAAPPVARPAMGINLAGPADWNTELPFVDAFRLARQWISQRRGEAWGKGPPLNVDDQGWVRRLEPNCFAETPLCTIDDGHYPSGEWTVLWEGEGKVELSKGRVVAAQPVNGLPGKED